MLKNGELKQFVYEIIGTLVGAFVLAVSVSLFLLPNELSSGGFSGIATILYYLFNFPMGITIIILNIPLFIIAILKIGKKFLIKTFVGMISVSLFIDWLETWPPLTSDKILACVYGGILAGLGTAIILRVNSSTGGSDLAGNVIKEYKPMARTGFIITCIDFVIVVLNVIFLKKIEIGLYSAISIYLMGKIIDVFFEGILFTKLIFIISDKNKEISEVIMKEINRGVTGLEGQGMYTGNNKLVLMCAISRTELVKLKSRIKVIDPNAFLIIANSREVVGSGSKNQ